jgi:hypothetical protein
VPVQMPCRSQVMYRTCNTDGLEGTESHDAISCDSASFAYSLRILLLSFSTRFVAYGKAATNSLTRLGCSQGMPPATFFEIYASLLQLRTGIASRRPISSASFLEVNVNPACREPHSEDKRGLSMGSFRASRRGQYLSIALSIAFMIMSY